MADAAASPAAQPEPTQAEVDATVRSKGFGVLLIISAIVGVAVSLAAWGFLELIHQIQVGVFTDLPGDFGYHHGAPVWWSLPVCGIGGLIVAVAIVFLPGRGGHIPAFGLNTGGGTLPIDLPGVLLAAFATIGLGLVLGPEAPLIALGGGLGLLTIKLARRDAPDQVGTVIAAAGTFAAVSMLFESPVIAAIILIEATALGGAKLRLILLPGLLAAGIGSLVSTGMGSFTGLSTSAYSLGALKLPSFPRPTGGNFGWTILVAVAVAVGCFLIMSFGRQVVRVVSRHLLLLLPIAGLLVSGLAIAYFEATGKGVSQVLFSGQDSLGTDVSQASTFSISALVLLLLFKGLAWGVSLGSFRGGPTFPALFLGAVAGMLASHLPGFSLTAGVAVGMGAAVVAVLRLPLSAVVLASFLTSTSGVGAVPLIVVGVVIAYITVVLLDAVKLPGRAAAATKPERSLGHATESPGPAAAS